MTQNDPICASTAGGWLYLLPWGCGVYQKTPRPIPKNPKMYQKNPRFVHKIPLLTFRNGPLQNQYAPTKTCFLPKKTTYLPHIYYTCGSLCTRKPTSLPLFVLKHPRMGHLGDSSFTPLSTTSKSTISSLFLGMKTFHCSLPLPFLYYHLPFHVAHLLLPPPPPLTCALWFFSGTSFTMGCFFFPAAEP